MAKEGQQRDSPGEAELTKLKGKNYELQSRCNGLLMKTLTLEARLSSEINRSVDLEVKLATLTKEMNEAKKEPVPCAGCLSCHKQDLGPITLEVKL